MQDFINKLVEFRNKSNQKTKDKYEAMDAHKMEQINQLLADTPYKNLDVWEQKREEDIKNSPNPEKERRSGEYMTQTFGRKVLKPLYNKLLKLRNK